MYSITRVSILLGPCTSNLALCQRVLVSTAFHTKNQDMQVGSLVGTDAAEFLEDSISK